MEQKLVDMLHGYAEHKPNTKYVALCGNGVIGVFDTPDAAFRCIGEMWCKEVNEGSPATTMLFTVQRTEAR